MNNDPMRPPLTGSVAQHVQRIRAGEAEREGRPKSVSGLSTAERYAQQILPGYKADEAARERARRSELRARGVWVPSDNEDTETAEAEADDVEEYDEEVEEETVDAPRATWEVYAARERQRIAAERVANRAAWRGSTDADLDRHHVI